MKIRSIASAAAMVCLTAPAFALTPAQIDNTTVQLWISGATAPTAGVAGAIAKLCDDADANGVADDLHIYLAGNVAANKPADATPGASAAGKFAAYACTMGAGAGANLSGKKAVIYHTFDVGSFEAYTPHLFLAGEAGVSGTVKRLNNISTSCSVYTQDPSTPTPIRANVYHNCGSSSVTVTPTVDTFGNPTTFALPTLPVGGLSDTEYLLNQLNLGITKNKDDIGMETPTNVGQAFGVAVSFPLYVAMQAAQGLNAAGACAPTLDAGGAFYSAVNLTPACQPTISKQKYASLVSAPADKSAALFGATGRIYLERRVGTSGTQSASNAYFLNKPCGLGVSGSELALAGSNVATSATNPAEVFDNATVTSNEGSSNVKSRLNSATENGTHAIGVLSLENDTGKSTEKFAYLKLGGVSPSADAAGTGIDTFRRTTSVSGDYDLWYELVAFTASSAPAEGTDLMAGIVANLADPAITNLKGLFPTALSGFTGTTVSKGFRAGNSCAPAVQ